MKPKGFIFGGFVNGLGLVRSLAKEGIKSDVFDIEPCLAGKSKSASFIKSPSPDNEKEFIKFVIKHAKNQSLKPVCFITNDIWLVPLLKNKKKLEEFLHFPMSDWDVIEKCYDKEYLSTLCNVHNIPHPKSYFPKNTTEIIDKLSDFNFPLILKPVETIGFMEKLNWESRNHILHNANDIKNVVIEMNNVGFHNRRIILQEIIPGDVKSLYTFTSYSNKKGKVIAWSIGHKLRQVPPEAGTISAGKVIPNLELEKIGINLIETLGFHGIANTEFKLDQKTGEFKLIEINARPGMWNLSALKSGINLPLLAYGEVCGHSNYKFSGTSNIELVWINSIYDFIYFFIGIGCEKKYRHNIMCRIKENKGKKIQSILSFSDPIPYIWTILKIFKKFFLNI